MPSQALFFGVGTNDSRLVGRLLSVSQPEFYELTQHEYGLVLGFLQEVLSQAKDFWCPNS